MTSSNGNIFRVTGPLCGEFIGPSEFPTQRPVMRTFDVFFDLRLNQRLRKQPWGWWCETPSWSLWRQCNAVKKSGSEITYPFPNCNGWTFEVLGMDEFHTYNGFDHLSMLRSKLNHVSKRETNSVNSITETNNIHLKAKACLQYMFYLFEKKNSEIFIINILYWTCTTWCPDILHYTL